MKKVLITGGNGFVGRAVLQSLSVDDEVEIHVISRKELPGNTKISYHKLSLMDYGKVNQIIKKVKPDYLVHLAWEVQYDRYLHTALNLDWVGASLNLLKEFTENGGKRAFFCGTCFEYEFVEAPFTEYETKTEPLTLYAQCKVSLHDIATKYCQLKQLSFVWGRLFYLFGEFENIHRVIPYAITELLKKNEVTCKNASAIRDYMYVSDTGEAITRTLFSDVVGDINIASGQPLSMYQIFQWIGETLQAVDRIHFLNEPVMPKQVIADVTKLKNEVGFTQYTNWQQALERTITWWRGKIK